MMTPADCDEAFKLEHVHPESGKVLATLDVVRGKRLDRAAGGEGERTFHLLRADAKVKPENGSRLTDSLGVVWVVRWSTNGLTGGKYIVRAVRAE